MATYSRTHGWKKEIFVPTSTIALLPNFTYRTCTLSQVLWWEILCISYSSKSFYQSASSQLEETTELQKMSQIAKGRQLASSKIRIWFQIADSRAHALDFSNILLYTFILNYTYNLSIKIIVTLLCPFNKLWGYYIIYIICREELELR